MNYEKLAVLTSSIQPRGVDTEQRSSAWNVDKFTYIAILAAIGVLLAARLLGNLATRVGGLLVSLAFIHDELLEVQPFLLVRGLARETASVGVGSGTPPAQPFSAIASVLSPLGARRC